jgi:hypothetical protein
MPFLKSAAEMLSNPHTMTSEPFLVLTSVIDWKGHGNSQRTKKTFIYISLNK